MDRIFADEWGKIVYPIDTYDSEVIVREGMLNLPGGKEVFPVRILNSEKVILCYDRSLSGKEKVEEMNQLAGQWIKVISGDLSNHIERGDKIAWLNILFGGRFPRFPHWYKKYVGKSDFGIIAVKNERILNKENKFGWDLDRWGFLPSFDGLELWKPMTNEEKRLLPFKKLEEIDKSYFDYNILAVIEGAAASGITSKREIENQIQIRKKLGLPPITNIYFFVIYGSKLAAQRLYEVCLENNIKLHYYFAGSAISVSSEGLLPGLPYTDLSHLADGSITFRSLYEFSKVVCTDLDGKFVKIRCCCGDVGESLDHADEYYISLVLENLILRIPLHVENLMRFWLDRSFLFRLKKRIEQIEMKNKTKIYNTIGERVSEIISKHEISLLKRKTHM